MLETELHFCSPQILSANITLQLPVVLFQPQKHLLCAGADKNSGKVTTLGSKNVKALFYSGYSDLKCMTERRFEPLHNIHSNCSFPKRNIFPGRFPQGEILSLQLRAEVVFKQEGEEQAHSAIPCAGKAASDLPA